MYVRVSAAIFTLIAVLQVLRVALALPVVIAGVSVPVAASIVAALGAGALAVWGWSSMRGGSR